MLKKASIIVLLYFTIIITGCGKSLYKPLNRRTLNNSKIALLCTFDIEAKTTGLVSGGLIDISVVAPTAKFIIVHNFDINNYFKKVVKILVQRLAYQNFIIEDNAIFTPSDLPRDPKKIKPYLMRKGFTHILDINLYCKYLHNLIIMSTAEIYYIARLHSARKIQWQFVHPKVQIALESLNGTNYSMDQCVGIKDTDPKYMLKIIQAFFKHASTKAFYYMKTNRIPRMKTKFNAESLMRYERTY